jgi:hypothetical protein
VSRVEQARAWLNTPLKQRRRYHWLLSFSLGALNGLIEERRNSKVKDLEERVQRLELLLRQRRRA